MPLRKGRKTPGPTILDYLNDDCWRCVLDYVDLKRVIISERVSRRWQAMVLRYMQTVRLALENPVWPTFVWPKVRWLKLKNVNYYWPSFKHWTEKLGSTVVVAYCTYESQLEILIKNCPNVESLMIVGFKGPISPNITTERFQRLQRLCFRHSLFVTDCCVSQLINSSVTELDIHGNICNGNEEEDDDDDVYCMDGLFLYSVKSKLESLTLKYIELDFDYLHLVVDWLSELKKLHLSFLPQLVFENIHLVLDKTPKLEHLHLDVRIHGTVDLSKHVCRLGNLRHLSGNVVWTDEHLEVVTQGCKELRSLEIKTNDISVRGLQAMVRNVGSRLVHLNLGYNHKLRDDDMVVCFRGCTTLTTLDVRWCDKLTTKPLCKLAAEARRGLNPRPPPLHLRGLSLDGAHHSVIYQGRWEKSSLR